MIKLLKLDRLNYAVVKSGTSIFVGRGLALEIFMTESCGIDKQEFKEALADMRNNDNNLADFGIRNTFILSLKADPEEVIQRSSSYC